MKTLNFFPTRLLVGTALLLPSLLFELSGQATYIDPTTTAALFVYSDALKSEQSKLLQEQKGLKSAQLLVAAQLSVVGEIQNTLLLGLSEVSGTLQNGIQVKTLLQDLVDCKTHAQAISQFVITYPQYAVFGAKASAQTYESVLQMSSDLTALLSSGNLNLASAGDRYRLLFTVSQKVQSLKIWLLTISMNLERAKRLGFLRAVSPFSTYVSTDRSIVQSILERYKAEF